MNKVIYLERTSYPYSMVAKYEDFDNIRGEIADELISIRMYYADRSIRILVDPIFVTDSKYVASETILDALKRLIGEEDNG